MNGIFYERSLEFAFKLLCQAFVTYNSGQCNVFQIEVNLFLDSDLGHGDVNWWFRGHTLFSDWIDRKFN